MDRLEEGIAHLRQDRYAEAIQCLEAVLASEPQNERALLYLGQAHMKLRDYPAAERYARRLVELLPDNATAWSNLGVALRKLGRFDKAREMQLKALSLEPEHSKARVELRKIQRDRAAVPRQASCTPDQSYPTSAPVAKISAERRPIVVPWAIGLSILVGISLVGYGVFRHQQGSGQVLRRAYSAHAASYYAEARQLYRRAAQADPGCVMAFVGGAFAELEINPFVGSQRMSPRGRSEGLIPASCAGDIEAVIDHLVHTTIKASWGLTGELDAADYWARAALDKLAEFSPEETVQMGFGMTTAEVQSICHGILADTATIRAAANVITFLQRLDSLLRTRRGAIVGSVRSLRQVSDLRLAIQWAQIGIYHGRLAAYYDYHNDEVAPILLTCQEIQVVSVEISNNLDDIDKLARWLGLP